MSRIKRSTNKRRDKRRKLQKRKERAVPKHRYTSLEQMLKAHEQVQELFGEEVEKNVG